jgi:phosphate starvation-inducible membrane PsiE
LAVAYPAAAIAIFLLFGWEKGGRLRIDLKSALLFFLFLALLGLITVDDLAIMLRSTLHMPSWYWVTISWVYPIFGSMIFFLFGKMQEKKRDTQ